MKFYDSIKRHLAKHYPGGHDHDQSTHGHGRGKFSDIKTRVGITSRRVGEQDQSFTSPEVYRDMKVFGSRLQKIKGVSDAHLLFGRGAWQGSDEPSWIVSYKGNGEARRLLAETGKKHNQDAVLVMYSKNGKMGVPSKMSEIDLHSNRLTNSVRNFIEKQLVETLGVPGWTWLKKSNGFSLRITTVPQWGGDVSKHDQLIKSVSSLINGVGFKPSIINEEIKVETMTRDGESDSYDSIIKEKF